MTLLKCMYIYNYTCIFNLVLVGMSLHLPENTDASPMKADTALANGQSSGINMNEPLFQQTFTLPPQPPTVFGHTNPMQTFLHGVQSTASPLPDMFHGTRHDQTPLFTKSPATSARTSLGPAFTKSKHMPKLNDISPTFAGTLQTKRPTQIASKSNSVNNKDLLQGIPHTAGFTEPPVHILSSNHAVPLHTPSSVTTTTISPPVAANDQLNIIVGDWTGADQHLSAPSKPPPLNVDHSHNHIHTHIHGVSEPAIPRPPPLSQDSLVSYEILPVIDSGKSLIMNSAKEKNGTNGNNMVKGMTDHIGTGSLENMIGLNLAEVNTGQTTQDAQLNSGPGNLQDLDINFTSVLDQNLNKHIGKYHRALVYLFDPYAVPMDKSDRQFDVVEIALNLTEYPYGKANEHINDTTLNNAMNLKQTLEDPHLSDTSSVTVIPSTFDMNASIHTTRSTTKSTGITKSYLAALNSTSHVYVAANESALGVNVSLGAISNITSSKIEATVNNTTAPTVAFAASQNLNNSKDGNTTEAISAYARGVNATSATITSTSSLTIAGSTTVDPDYLADLAEAQEEAAQRAAEIAELIEAGEITIAMTTTQSNNVTLPDTLQSNSTSV